MAKWPFFSNKQRNDIRVWRRPEKRICRIGRPSRSRYWAVGAALQAQHAAYFADFMAERKQDIRTNRQLEALELIDPDFENVRSKINDLPEQNVSNYDSLIVSLQ